MVQAAWYRLTFPTYCVRMYFRSDYGSGRMVQVDVPHLLCKNVFQSDCGSGSVVRVDVPQDGEGVQVHADQGAASARRGTSRGPLHHQGHERLHRHAET